MSTGGPIDELEAALAFIDVEHAAAIKDDPDPGYVDLAASVRVLNTLGIMLQNLGITSLAFQRLHLALEALRHGEKPYAMLEPRNTNRTAPDRASIEMMKGGLAAIVTLGMAELGVDGAADWVMNHLARYPKVEVVLRRDAAKPVTRDRLVKWRERFKNRAKSNGSRQYEQVLLYERDHRVSREILLRAVLSGIGGWLPTEINQVSIK
jgi:hypothetical protein